MSSSYEEKSGERSGENSIQDSTSKSSFVATIKDIAAPKREPRHSYITGLRGILVIQSFIWIFFETFIPTLVSNKTPGPVYQDILRYVFNVPFWNASLIYNFFVILSMRTICVSFLENPTGQTYAATIIRRTVRIVLAVGAASAISMLIFSQIGTLYVDEFKTKLPNRSIATPSVVYDGGAAIGALFNLFWLTGDWFTQAANDSWPSATLWVPSVIYYQSFTVYFLMVILPFTRPRWHIQGLGLFALGSFWMAYWGWYSATGLFFADLAINATLKADAKAGLRIGQNVRIPYWILALISTAAGMALKYFVIVLPQFVNKELVLHPYLDLSENHSVHSFAAAGPYARLDDFLVICGIMTVVELFETAQRCLSFEPLIWLGERSFSKFNCSIRLSTLWADQTRRHICDPMPGFLDGRNQALAHFDRKRHHHCWGQRSGTRSMLHCHCCLFGSLP